MKYFVHIFSSQWSRANFEAKHRKEKGFCLLPSFVLLLPSPLLDLEKGDRTGIKKRNNRWMNKEVVIYINSVQFSRPVMSDSLQPHELQHARPPCLSPTPGVHPNPSPSSRWCISSCCPLLLLPFIFPSIRVFSNESALELGGQSNEVSASTSIFPMNTQDWSPLGWTDWISLTFKGLSRVFSNTTVQKHQFFGAQLSL